MTNTLTRGGLGDDPNIVIAGPDPRFRYGPPVVVASRTDRWISRTILFLPPALLTAWLVWLGAPDVLAALLFYVVALVAWIFVVDRVIAFTAWLSRVRGGAPRDTSGVRPVADPPTPRP